MNMPKMNTTMKPKLALCNFLADVIQLREFAFRHGFSGIDWSFDASILPATPLEESEWVKQLSTLDSFEIRYHCPFYQIDLGHQDPAEAKAAEAIFRRIIGLVSKVEGKYLTIHIGLGHDSTEPLSWEATIKNLTRLVQYGAQRGVTICLENLAWGWTSRPHLFEKLIRGSGAAVTFDIGHARVCESVRSHAYLAEDFVAPHSDRVVNAHIYHKEVSDQGHIPPDRLEDIQDRLAVLENVGCMWWVLEVRGEKGLLKTQRIVEEYLTQSERYNSFDGQGPLASLTSHG
jgi:sugar phosphate isomerase/epimerase